MILSQISKPQRGDMLLENNIFPSEKPHRGDMLKFRNVTNISLRWSLCPLFCFLLPTLHPSGVIFRYYIGLQLFYFFNKVIIFFGGYKMLLRAIIQDRKNKK